MDNAKLQHLAKGELADLIWEAPPDFTTEHAHLCHAALQALLPGVQDAGIA